MCFYGARRGVKGVKCVLMRRLVIIQFVMSTFHSAIYMVKRSASCGSLCTMKEGDLTQFSFPDPCWVNG